MEKIILLILAIGIGWSAFGQADMGNINAAENFRFNVRSIKDISSIEDIGKYFDGSVLLFDDWQEGIVTMSSGRTERRLMNYFLLDNSLLYKEGTDSILTFVFTDRVKSVQIRDKMFEMVTYMEKKDGKVETGVMEIVLEGSPLTLAKKYNTIVKEGQDGSGYKEAVRPSIEAKVRLFYRMDGNLLTPVPNKKKEFYSIFNDKADQVEAYAKKNKLRINDAGITAMSEYYNSLF